MKHARIVVGLGFGDEGKGLTTDFLCQSWPNSIVIRFSGGQQCGHHVCIGSQRHVHSSFGSGTLRGLPSYFSAHCCFYPVTLWQEYQQLCAKGVQPTLYLHPLCKLTTPFDVLANRLSEHRQAHGSCGLGIGKTMQREAAGYCLYAQDTLYPDWLAQKLNLLRDYYFQQFTQQGWVLESAHLDWLTAELQLFQEAIAARPYQISDYHLLQPYSDFIFEGSQGILLDQTHGLFPHVTYAHTTSRNAVEICRALAIDHWELFYVTRCYSTRHGKGWLPQEGHLDLINTEFEINHYNRYQGHFRYGELDYAALNHALAIDALYAGSCRKNLVVTCLDQRPDFCFDYTQLHSHFDRIYESRSPFAEQLKALLPNNF